jgi:amino acid transporter
MAQVKIPLWVAILINANIVIGSAFFLGAGEISVINGILGPLAWLLCGLLLLPLVIVLARLATRYPAAGGLYVYSNERLGSLWGFVSGWGYFVGTVAANAAVLHAFSVDFQKIESIGNFLSAHHIGGLRFDFLLVVLFTIFNLCNIEFLEGAQITFTVLKSIPLLLVLCALPFLFNVNNLVFSDVHWMSLLKTLPLVLFAYIGIEACCAVADKIEGGKDAAARVIFISFGAIVSIYALLQFALLCIHGTDSTNPFFAILPRLTNNSMIIQWGNAIVYGAILSSFLGGFYGMFYYNNWNLFAIGKQKSILFGSYLTKTLKNQAPWVNVLVQACLVMLFLWAGRENYYLITMSDFGTTMAYLLSAVAFLTLSRSVVVFFALISCSLLIFICSSNLLSAGIYHVIPFITILLLGIIAHKINERFVK